ncbi:MAG: hypothetical protein MOGMAGMI_00289 [Candidatus Omnitrophica bacterium]|nr:hypothetical protein [Candidatus Omnitrophota bacterium]
MSSDIKDIYSKLTSISISCAKIETQVEGLQRDVEDIKNEDSKQNQLLAEHILGVKTNMARLNEEIETRRLLIHQLELENNKKHLDLEQRLKEVEFLPNFIKSTFTIIKWSGASAAAIFAIWKLIDLLK